MREKAPEPALYRRLVRLLLPAQFRERHEEDLVQVFSELLLEADARSGFWGRATAWLREVPSLVRLARRVRRRGESPGGGGGRRSGTGVSWLDLKLGLRMLRKQWGLTLVGGLAMTIAIGIGTVVFAAFDLVFWPTLPLDEGDRVVAIQTWDEGAHRRSETSVRDFERWRDGLRSLEDIGAFQTIERNMVIAGGPARPVSVAVMTASGFQLARVRPLMGRPLLAEDEREDATPTVVIGYDVWQSQFSADPAVLGQTVRLGGTVHTVVGVMPEGFGFPVNHRFWTPLRADPSDDLKAPPEGSVFARLAPGVTMEGAQAELATIGVLAVPETDAELRARVVPYALGFTGDIERGEAAWVIRLTLLLVTFLLVPPCANIAILVYARTVTRQEEFAARYAMGASRGRIVGQLFIEVLVLAVAAAGVALVIVREVVGRAEGFLVGVQPPFWVNFSVSFRTILFAAGLAILCAMIAGLVPALKATGRHMESGLRTLGGRTGARLGGTWTALVVAQIALTLAVLPAAVEMGWGTLRSGILGPGFASEEFLTARLAMDQETLPNSEADRGGLASSFASLQAELVRQLEEEPGVSGVTVAAAVPNEEPWLRIEVEGGRALEDGTFESTYDLVRSNRVDDSFFDMFDIPLLTGRGFDTGDLGTERAAVIVNRTFAQELLGEGNPLGRRVRYTDTRDGPARAASESGRWYEIVGVVDDLFATTFSGTMYHPVAPGQMHPASLVLRVGPDVGGVAGRLREMTAALNLSLRVDRIRSMDEIFREQQEGNYLGASALAAVTLSVLLLSAAGMYALMSFTVNQRRREIGIRSALGAQPRHLLAGIFKRALRQLGVGAAVGVLLALLLDRYMPIEQMGGLNVPGMIPAAAAFMMIVGLLAANGPARRGLRVQPTEALREGG